MAFFNFSFSLAISFSLFLDCRASCLEVNLRLKRWSSIILSLLFPQKDMVVGGGGGSGGGKKSSVAAAKKRNKMKILFGDPSTQE